MITGQEKISDLLKRFPSSQKVLAKFGLTLEAEAHFRFRNLAHAAIIQKLSLRQILTELGEATGEKITEVKVSGVQAPLKPGFRQGTPAGIHKTIAIHSGKGGVGKTFIAINLAALLASKGFRVGLLDADIDCPNVMHVLQLSGKFQADAEKKIVPLVKFGMKVVSMAPLLGGEPLLWRGPIISRVVEQFIHDVNWGELDFLIVDLPPGTADAPLTLLNILKLTGLIVATTPHPLGILDAQKSILMAQKLKVKIMGLVENMAGDIFGKGEGKKSARKFGIPFLGSIELNKKFIQYVKGAKPPVLLYDDLRLEFEKIVKAAVGAKDSV